MIFAISAIESALGESQMNRGFCQWMCDLRVYLTQWCNPVSLTLIRMRSMRSKRSAKEAVSIPYFEVSLSDQGSANIPEESFQIASISTDRSIQIFPNNSTSLSRGSIFPIHQGDGYDHIKFLSRQVLKCQHQ